MGTATEVVIPTYNGLAVLRESLAALAGEAATGVCVVDNGSSDGTVTAVEAEFPACRVVSLPRNLGFGAAVNRGVETSEADRVVLLNNDAIVRPGFVGSLLEAGTQSGAEMVAGCLVARDGSIETLGTQIDQSLIAYDHLYSQPWRPDAGSRNLEPVLGPCGGAALFEREALLAVGGFDERIFAYLEDVELGIRMRLAGMRLALAPDAVAVHEHSSTLGSGSERKNYLLGWSRGYILRRHGAMLTSRSRLRGAVIESVVYAGKAAIDHNLGATRGRVHAARIEDESLTGDLAGVPLLRLTIAEALSRRFARRR